MKLIVYAMVTATLLLGGSAGAEDQIRWTADYRAACQLAADQNRLVLLHFYNDNCEPCVRLERNVFSQAAVGEAVATNFVPVKVHAGQDPQLANRYRVRSWPTDVFVTASGLEVYRSISPQKPDDYISLVNQVAQQTGVSAGRNWQSKLGQAISPAAGAAEGAANNVRQAAEQVAVTGQDNSTQGHQRWSAALDQFKTASDQARATTSQTAQQVDNRWRQTQDQASIAGQQWSQQTTDAVKRYEQQGGEAYRQFRDQATQAGQNIQQQAQQIRQDIGASAQQTGATAENATSRWQQTFSQAAADAASSAAGIAAAASEKTAAAPPLLPSENPWLALKQQAAAAPADSAARETAPRETSSRDAVPDAIAASNPPAFNPPFVPPSLGAQSPTAAPALNGAPPLAAAPASVPTSAPASAPAPPATPAPWTRGAFEPAAVAAVAGVLAPQPAQGGVPANMPPQPPLVPGGQQPTQPAMRPGQLVDASQAPPIAMDGFCPVSLLETVTRDPHDRAAWKKGNVKFGAIHRKRTYLFTSFENQQKFLANPDVYAPALDGCDPVVFAERGTLLDGKRAYGLITPDKRIYLFADEAALRKFNQSPASYASAAQQAMHREGGIYR